MLAVVTIAIAKDDTREATCHGGAADLASSPAPSPVLIAVVYL